MPLVEGIKTGMGNETPVIFKKMIVKWKAFIHLIALPELVNRVIALGVAFGFFLIPDLLALGIFFNQIFNRYPEIAAAQQGDQTTQIWIMAEGLLTKGVVIALIFCIGLLIALVATENEPRLEGVLVWLSMTLVMVSGSVAWNMSGRCISDLHCNTYLYWVGLLLAVLLAAAGLVIARGIHSDVSASIFVYMAVLFRQTWLWLDVILERELIGVSVDLLKAVFLMVFSLFMALMLFIVGSQPQQVSTQPHRK